MSGTAMALQRPLAVSFVPGQLFDPILYSMRLRAEIARRGLEQKDAAREIGIDASTVSRICKHAKVPTVENYLRINSWMTSLSCDSGSGSQSEDAPKSAAEAVGPQSGGEAASPKSPPNQSSPSFNTGVEACRKAAIALAEKHMQPALARKLVAQHPNLAGPLGGFLLAMGHIRDDLLWMHEETALSDQSPSHGGGT